MSRLNCIFACTSNGGIGINGDIPWIIPEDLSYFRKITIGNGNNAVVMGKNTWNSIPEKYRPLSNRFNIVITRDKFDKEKSRDYPDDIVLCGCLDEAIHFVDNLSYIEDIFVIGGQELYYQSFYHARLYRIYKTLVDTNKSIKYDTFVPTNIPSEFFLKDISELKTYGSYKYQFQTFVKHQECQYFNIIKDILRNGSSRNDRTGTGTLSLFGQNMKFDLRDNSIPVFTTKKVFWRGVVEELLWFISGYTYANILKNKDIHIWDKNGSREFLDNLGLTKRREGDLGPVYGFQWRHFGAKYIDCNTDYSGEGIDQLARVIDLIKNNPTDRRIVMSAWNPKDMSNMALPPCHILVQFFVDTERGELSSQMYQRSCDIGLGVPFNVASYSLLTHMIAQVCGLKAGYFNYCMGDTHIYRNHIEPLKEQLKRKPYEFPKIELDPNITDIDDFTIDHINLVGYNCHQKISMDMSS
tara:strand:- start:4423 stop:5826 length:1404 start_codon:yes stop_codon:yes gene_type:complete